MYLSCIFLVVIYIYLFWVKLHEMINIIIKTVVHYFFGNLIKIFEKLDELEQIKFILFVVAKFNTIK